MSSPSFLGAEGIPVGIDLAALPRALRRKTHNIDASRPVVAASSSAGRRGQSLLFCRFPEGGEGPRWPPVRYGRAPWATDGGEANQARPGQEICRVAALRLLSVVPKVSASSRRPSSLRHRLGEARRRQARGGNRRRAQMTKLRE